MILMHAGQPGTRRRSMAKPTGGAAHSTIVEYEGDENEVTQAIRKGEQPSSGNMALFAKPKMQFGMAPGARNPQHGRQREILPSEEVAERSVTASMEAAEAPRDLRRRQHSESSHANQWTQRGMFKLGFNSGSPRVRSARKFTK